MNSKIILPMEIINKILIMRPSHPITDIIKPLNLDYNEYTNHDDYISFFEYIMKYYELYVNYNIKCCKKYDHARLRCHGCGYYFKCGDLYFNNGNSINCNECFNGH